MKVNAAKAMALAAIQQKTTQYLQITQEEPRIFMTVILIHASGSGSYLYWSINAAHVQMALTLGCEGTHMTWPPYVISWIWPVGSGCG